MRKSALDTKHVAIQIERRKGKVKRQPDERNTAEFAGHGS